MTDREIFKLALDCLENAVDLQQSEIDMHILHYGEWYRPQRVEFMKKYLNKTNQSIEAIRARLAQPEQEPNPWRFAAQRLGEDLSTVGPDGYYNMSASEWLDWAMKHITPARIEQEPYGYLWFTHHMERRFTHYKPKEEQRIGDVMPVYATPPQREWQGLTDKEYEAMAEKYVTNCYFDTLKYARAIEAKLKEKNA